MQYGPSSTVVGSWCITSLESANVSKDHSQFLQFSLNLGSHINFE